MGKLFTYCVLDMMCPAGYFYDPGFPTATNQCSVSRVDRFRTKVEGCFCDEKSDKCPEISCPCLDSNKQIINHGAYFNDTYCRLW